MQRNDGQRGHAWTRVPGHFRPNLKWPAKTTQSLVEYQATSGGTEMTRHPCLLVYHSDTAPFEQVGGGMLSGVSLISICKPCENTGPKTRI